MLYRLNHIRTSLSTSESSEKRLQQDLVVDQTEGNHLVLSLDWKADVEEFATIFTQCCPGLIGLYAIMEQLSFVLVVLFQI